MEGEAPPALGVDDGVLRRDELGNGHALGDRQLLARGCVEDAAVLHRDGGADGAEQNHPGRIDGEADVGTPKIVVFHRNLARLGA